MSFINQIIDGTLDYAIYYPDGSVSRKLKENFGIHICPGTFFPLHSAHKKFKEYVEDHFPNSKLYYELSIHRLGKQPLDTIDVIKIISQFADFAPIIITDAESFAQKDKLFPNSCFHIGYDSAERLYKNCSLEEIENLSCCFYVYNRNFKSIADWPQRFVPKNMFAIHSNFPIISSTELRVGLC